MEVLVSLMPACMHACCICPACGPFQDRLLAEIVHVLRKSRMLDQALEDLRAPSTSVGGEVCGFSSGAEEIREPVNIDAVTADNSFQVAPDLVSDTILPICMTCSFWLAIKKLTWSRRYIIFIFQEQLVSRRAFNDIQACVHACCLLALTCQLM